MKLILQKEIKNQTYSLRMTEKQRALLEAKAELYGVTLAEWLIYCGENYVPGKHEIENGSKKRTKKGRA